MHWVLLCVPSVCVCTVSEDYNEGHTKPSYSTKIVRRPALAYMICGSRTMFCAAPDTVAGYSQC